MNAALILAGGSGRRFQSNLPKQYHRLRGRMVIEYVLRAALRAKKIDQVLICAAPGCKPLQEIQPRYGFSLAPGGETRNQSLQSGLDWLKAHGCENVIVLDAVRPLVTGELMDLYMDFLSEGYDAVVTAQKITDSLGCYDLPTVDRARYYLMQSPEAFRFPLLHASFNSACALTEVTQQLPQGSHIKLYFDFTDNLKLTYPWEKAYLARALAAREAAQE